MALKKLKRDNPHHAKHSELELALRTRNLNSLELKAGNTIGSA